MDAKKLYSLALNPWVILGSLALGFLVGSIAPKQAMQLGFLGDIYVDLLKMITLPFMVSAIIFSLQRLFREGGTGKLLGRLAVVFLAASVFVAIIGALSVIILRPGADLPPETMAKFGQIVGNDLNSSDTAMSLEGADEVKKSITFTEMLISMVPANIFNALAVGDTLKALVFAMLFGLAVGLGQLVANAFSKKRVTPLPDPVSRLEIVTVTSAVLINTLVTIAGLWLFRRGWVRFRDDVGLLSIVDVFVLLLGMDMRDAVGSSLVVIALNSAAGLLGHLGDGGLNWLLVALLLAGGVPGLLLGAGLARRLPAARLRQSFAVFVVLLGVALLAINLPLLLG